MKRRRFLATLGAAVVAPAVPVAGPIESGLAGLVNAPATIPYTSAGIRWLTSALAGELALVSIPGSITLQRGDTP